MNIKILVCYHKKDELFKNDILLPMHCGRSVAMEKSKDGKISQDDYNWCLDNLIGDNTGENISDLNREVNEMTAIYWVWKNYNEFAEIYTLKEFETLINTEIKNLDNIEIKFFVK